MKKIKKILVRRIMPAIMSVALMLTAVSLPVTAATEPKDSVMDCVLADAIQDGKERTKLAEETGDRSLLYDTSYFNLDSAQTQTKTKTFRGISAAAEENLPSKYDLREEGYVTPVKLQYPFGTCWGFATIAAAESSILSEKKMKYDKETNDLDLSELHLAWFGSHALPEDSSTGQGGEGIYPGSETSEGLNAGGVTYYGTVSFASGMGPRSEKDIPYQPKDPENHIYTVKVPDQNGDLFDLPLMYKADADWSVDESERFGIGGGGYELEESSILPSPADRTESGEYQYNEEGTKAIKKELMEGRAVSLGFSADYSSPGQELGEGVHMNPDTWAHFTYDVNDEVDHSVTIVGWDDDYAVSNFLEGHQPEGPGAWIVKNSWGAASNKFPHWYPWGDDGYFYLSYYDRSIYGPETFNFFTEGSGYDELYANQYDYMPAEGLDIHASDKKVSEANVFRAEDGDMTLRCVAATTSKAGAKITYEIYKLNDNYTSPTDGTLLETIENTYEYAGYHRENLKTEQHFRMGEPYSVVVTQESDGRYLYGAASGTSKTSWERLPEEKKPYLFYSVGVIHQGESFLGSEDESGEYEWEDWKDFTQKYLAATGNMTTLDNFAIKTYSDPYDGFSAQTTEKPQTTKEPQTTNLSTADVTLATKSYTYNGKSKTPDVKVTVAGKTLTRDKDYTVSYKNNKNAGKATVTVTAKENSGYTGSKAVNFTIKKASQTLKLKVSKKSYKAKRLKKKKATFKIKSSKNKTTVTYKVTKGASKYIRVSKKGVVTMKKGVKKGTYKVRVTAKASANYKSVKKIVTITVK